MIESTAREDIMTETLLYALPSNFDFISPAGNNITEPPLKKMPPITRETLALRLRQNWLAKHPVDVPAAPSGGPGLDDSLTSLNWLQNLNILKIPTPTPPASPTPAEQAPCPGLLPQSYNTNMQVNPNAILNMTGNLPIKQIKQEPGPVQAPYHHRGMGGLLEVTHPIGTALDKIDYKTNGTVKPPYSYATLICMAMRESKKNKITLAGIYNWITENFMYYRVADPSWQVRNTQITHLFNSYVNVQFYKKCKHYKTIKVYTKHPCPIVNSMHNRKTICYSP